MPKKNIKTIAIIVIITLVGWAANNFWFSKPELTKMSASIAVARTPLSAPFYIADYLGLYEKHGLDVSLIEVIGGKNSFKTVMSRKADYGTSSESVLMFESINKSKFVNLASFVESDNDIQLLVHASNDVADLKGKKIGVIKGSASEYFLSLFLGLNNLKRSDVELVSLAPNTMADALASRKVDAVSVWEPYAYEIKKALGKDVYLAKARNIYSLTFNLITQNKVGSNLTARNIRLLRAIKEAIEYIQNSPLKAQKIVREQLGLNQNFMSAIWPDYYYNLSLRLSLMLTIKDEARWAAETGLINLPAQIDFEKYIDTRALSIVDKNAVQL